MGVHLVFSPNFLCVIQQADATGDETCDRGVSPAKKMKCAGMEDWFDDVFVVYEDQVSKSVVVEKEVSMYLGSTKSTEDRDTTLLQWWKK